MNKQSLNASNTNDIVIGKRKINCHIDIQINNNKISSINKTTFHGIMIDEQLKWTEQIHQVQTGMSRITGVMYRASNVSGTASFLTLYHLLCLLPDSTTMPPTCYALTHELKTHMLKQYL